MEENNKIDFNKLMDKVFGGKNTGAGKNSLFAKTAAGIKNNFFRQLLTGFPIKKSQPFATGLDIGVSAVKSAVFSYQGDAARLEALDIEEISHEDFEGPRRPEAVREAVKKIQSRGSLKGKVVASVPLPNLLVELMYLPVMPQEELDKAVRWEAKEKLLVDEESYVIDYLTLGEVKVAQQAQKEILFFSAPKSDVLDNYRLLSGLGLRVAAITPNLLAVFQGLENKSAWREDEAVGILDIGAGSSQFSIVSGGHIRLSRRFNISGDSVTRSVADYCRISYEEAERNKRDVGMSRMALEEDRKDGGVSAQPVVRISHALGLHLDQLITEIQHTFSYFSLEASGEPVSKMNRLILTGGGASMKGIAEFFKNRLNIPVDIPSPLNYIQSAAEGKNMSRFMDRGPGFAAALGLARAQPAKNINLLPPELRYGFLKRAIFYNEAHPKKTMAAALAVFCAAALMLSAGQAIMLRNYSAKAQRAETSVHQLQAKYKETAGIMNQLSQNKQALGFQVSLLNKRAEFLKGQYNFGHNWATALREFKRLVPNGAWLVGFKTEEYYLKISGGALDEKTVGDFMAILRKSPAFSNVFFNYVQASQVGKTKVILFELTCNYDLQFMKTRQFRIIKE